MSSASLQVITGRFFRLECNHEQLFQSEYKRSNRTKGLKILRCFPHCCPEHIDRSYCGSSLSVAIRLAKRPVQSALLSSTQRQVVSVFARFEAVSDGSLRTGECVEVDTIHRAMQTETNLDGQWIAGVLDRPLEIVAMVRAASGDDDGSFPDENSLVFHLNSKVCSRWYYDWESGANKAQRLMKHVLKAYVVERVAVELDKNGTTVFSKEVLKQLYRVVYVVSSPKFTVVSYRRAPLDQLQLPRATNQLAESRAPQHVTTRTREGVSPKKPQALNQTHEREIVHNTSVMSIAHDRDVTTAWSTLNPSPLGIDVHDVEAKRRLQKHSDYQDLMHYLEDKLFWEHSNAPAVAVSKNMALLFAFIRWAPLRLYAPFIAELVHLVDQKIFELAPASATKLGQLNCFSRLLVYHAQIGISVQATGEEGTTHEYETLLQVASQTVLWLFSWETCYWIRTFFHQNAISVLDKKAMRSCFLHFLCQLEERLNAQVLAATTLCRLPNVAEEVIAAVYSRECFHDRRQLVRQIITGQSFAGWNMFVAQMRDTYISATSLRMSKAHSDWNTPIATAFPPCNAVEQRWHGEWYLDIDDVQWDINETMPSAGSADSRAPDVSFFSLVKLISQLVRLEVALDIQESSLRVRVPQNVTGCIVDCMQLILDGKDRVYRTFPNGLTTCGSDGVWGDYVGQLAVEGPGQLVIYLQVFNWSLEQGTPSYRVRANIKCHNNSRLSVDGNILETTGSSTFTADKLSSVGEMSLRAKLKSVEEASTRRHHADDASRDTPAASWVEYGRFHLSYQKMSTR